MNDSDLPEKSTESQGAPATVSLRQLAGLFLTMGALSFGGGLMAWSYREIVEKRKWLTTTDFLGGLTLCQILPGVNMSNLSTYVGQRLQGWRGALVAHMSLLLVPFFAIIVIGTSYELIVAIPGAQLFLDGVATSAVGLFLSVGLKTLKTVRQIGHILVLIAVVVLIGFLRLPLVPVILLLTPISVALAWRNGGQPNAG